MSPIRSRACRRPATLLALLSATVAFAPSPAMAAREATLVKQISTATHTAGVTQVVELGGALYFVAERENTYPSPYPTELYRTDGTRAGTTLVFDSVGPISYLRVVDGALVFQGSTVENQQKTFTSNGTAAGTVPASARIAAAGPNAVATTDGSLYSSSTLMPPGSSGGSLIKRAPGSNEPIDALPGITVSGYVALGDVVYVSGYLTSGPTEERHGIWITDGTAAGTTRLARPTGATYTAAVSLTAAADAVYFVGTGPGISGGPETDDGPNTLYRATAAGITHIVKPDGGRLDHTDAPRALGNRVTFHLLEDGKNALWVTDGTPAGTKELIGPEPAWPTANRNFFDRSSGGHVYTVRGGREIWRTDGTSAGTSKFGVIGGYLEPSDLSDFTAFGDKVWFSAYTAPYGTELWSADGTTTGARIAFDLNTRPRGTSITDPVRLGDHAYFGASDGSAHAQLWRSDGTATGTNLVASFPTSFGRYASTFLSKLTATDDAVYVVHAGGMSSALWKVLPNGDKTLLFGNENLSGTGPYLGGVTAWSDGIAFVAPRKSGQGSTIWTSDGTVAGTNPLPGEPAAAQSSPLRAIGGSLYFASPSASGQQLAKTDGTAGGTSVLTSLAGTDADQISGITRGLGDTPWFIRRPIHVGPPTGLLKADAASPTGATLIKQSAGIGAPQATFGGRMYFEVYSDDPAQSGLASTDGTAVGTRLEEAGTREAHVIDDALTFVRTSGTWPNTQSSLWTTKTTFAAATRIDSGAGEVGRAFEANGYLLFGHLTDALGFQLFGVSIKPDPVVPDPPKVDPPPTPRDPTTNVDGGQPQPAGPTPTAPAFKLDGIAFNATVARDRKSPYKFSFTADLKAKAAFSAATCTGSVRVTILRGTKTVATKDAPVASGDKGRCTAKLDVAVARGKLARRGSLKAKVAFVGADPVAAFNAPGHVKLRYG